MRENLFQILFIILILSFFSNSEVRSINRTNFGECMFVFKFVANFVSLSFSPSGRHIVIGLRCKKGLKFAYILDKDTRWRIGVNSYPEADGTECQDSGTSSSNGKYYV